VSLTPQIPARQRARPFEKPIDFQRGAQLLGWHSRTLQKLVPQLLFSIRISYLQCGMVRGGA
jgi:hypothetical protein